MLYFEILLKHEQPVRKGVCMWRVRNRVFPCVWDLVSKSAFSGRDVPNCERLHLYFFSTVGRLQNVVKFKLQLRT